MPRITQNNDFVTYCLLAIELRHIILTPLSQSTICVLVFTQYLCKFLKFDAFLLMTERFFLKFERVKFKAPCTSLSAAQERLIETRKELGLSQAEFAKGFGLTQSGLSAFELGTVPMRATIALAIEAAYGVSHLWMMEGALPKYVSAHLTGEERRLISLFRATERASQQVVLRVLNGLASKTSWDGTRERRSIERRAQNGESTTRRVS